MKKLFMLCVAASLGLLACPAKDVKTEVDAKDTQEVKVVESKGAEAKAGEDKASEAKGDGSECQLLNDAMCEFTKKCDASGQAAAASPYCQKDAQGNFCQVAEAFQQGCSAMGKKADLSEAAQCVKDIQAASCENPTGTMCLGTIFDASKNCK